MAKKALITATAGGIGAAGPLIGENGRVFDDMYLFQVKAPGESKGAWDYFNLVKTNPAAQAYVDPKESGCPLVK